MSTANKRKGAKWELDVVKYLRRWWPQADRKQAGSTLDRGDVSDVPGWTLECKAERAIDLAGYMGEAEEEARNAGTPYFAAVVKRRNKSVEEAYVVMPLKVWTKLVGGDPCND